MKALRVAAARVWAMAAVTLVAACATRPYVPPQPVSPLEPAYKENVGWKPGQPADAALRGNWWEVFGDPQLNALEQQVDISN